MSLSHNESFRGTPTSDKEMADSKNEFNDRENESQQQKPSSEKTKQEEKKEDEKKNDKGSDDRESIFYIIQKATLQCNQGFTFPKLKVTSHQKHYANHPDRQGYIHKSRVKANYLL